MDDDSGFCKMSSGSSAYLPTTKVLVIGDSSVVVEEALTVVDALSLMVGFN